MVRIRDSNHFVDEKTRFLYMATCGSMHFMLSFLHRQLWRRGEGVTTGTGNWQQDGIGKINGDNEALQLSWEWISGCSRQQRQCNNQLSGLCWKWLQTLSIVWAGGAPTRTTEVENILQWVWLAIRHNHTSWSWWGKTFPIYPIHFSSLLNFCEDQNIT